MAGDAVIGALRVVLGADTAAFEDGLKKATSRANSFASSISKIAAGIGLEKGIEKAVEGIVHAFKHALTSADELGKMAQKVGIPVEELTALKVAADLSDVSMESLSSGLGKLSKNMVEAAGGSKEAKDKFDALGISVRDSSGNLKSSTQVLSEMADKFHGSKDGAEKVATALGLLGKGGKDLIPLLNEGGGSLKEFAQLAKNMGLEISTNTANQTQRFNDNIKILSFSMEGVSNLVVKDLIPGFVRMSNTLVDTAKGGTAIRSTADFIVSGFKKVVQSIIVVIEYDGLLAQAFNAAVEGINHSINGMIEVFSKAVEPIGNFVGKIVDAIVKRFTALAGFLAPVATAIIDHFSKRISGIRDLLPAVKEETKGVNSAFEEWKNTLTSPEFEKADKAFDTYREKLKRIGEISPAAKKLVDELFSAFEEGAHKATKPLATVDQNANKFKETIFDLGLKTRDVSGEFINLAPGFVEAARGLKLFDESGKGLDATLSLSTQKAAALNDAMLFFKGAQITQETLLPWEAYEQQITRLNLLLDAGGLSNVAYARKAQAAADAAGLTWKTAGAGIAGSFTEIAASAGSANSQIVKQAKVFAAVQALIAAYAGSAEALASTAFPANLAAAALVLAKGFALVASIKAVQIPGFARGGSFQVGGTGGIDSQLVQFMASPSEMVDVHAPGQDRRGGGGSGGEQRLIVSGISPREYYRGDVLRDIVQNLIDYQRDGGTVVLEAA